ncbi:hypothetical protein EW146_g3892 [Bondarzewia mesenterica]|uniref:Uncharacterized protein n=1 Tax=Bondarzewia mesenterica TaxID=1095465 RepID=A0A4S4LW93_9AGAM|nr:hypothetical protein EW146_g3892 [Bondarzewia mesenterica]
MRRIICGASTAWKKNEEDEDELKTSPDYARGEALLESSDEEDQKASDESDADDVVILGRDASKPIRINDDDAEIDLDEQDFADLDAQAAAYSKAADAEQDEQEDAPRTRRLAVVNLDWDYVRASHLFRIFASVVSPPVASSSKISKNPAPFIRGKVLSVRVYPSQFGQERLEREEKEGPPVELFKKKGVEDEEINETNIYETGDADEYDEDALRKYQLERLRYYYAIVECDTVQATSHLYSELQGTELERSANVFDLSFVPDNMTFEEDPRDEVAGEDLSTDYKGLDFVTDALRHSKVKLTWDQDDPERNRVTRRNLTRKEIEENDFRAYVASSSGSESESDGDGAKGKSKKDMEREKLRALLLGGGGNDLPEGWGGGAFGGDDKGDVDMEVTFMPALSGAKTEDETTLEKYQRKMKEKRKKRKEELRVNEPGQKSEVDDLAGDKFFGESGSEGEDESIVQPKKGRKKGKRGNNEDESEQEVRRPSTKEELSLLVDTDHPGAEPKHFSMKAVLRAEKKKGRKGKKGKKSKEGEEGENELQEDFMINVQDERFKALHEDHTFAIDPSNPHFKKTKSMAVLLQERSKQRRQKQGDRVSMGAQPADDSAGADGQSLKSLVESVKRKSAVADEGVGKRRKL